MVIMCCNYNQNVVYLIYIEMYYSCYYFRFTTVSNHILSRWLCILHLIEYQTPSSRDYYKVRWYPCPKAKPRAGSSSPKTLALCMSARRSLLELSCSANFTQCWVPSHGIVLPVANRTQPKPTQTCAARRPNAHIVCVCVCGKTQTTGDACLWRRFVFGVASNRRPRGRVLDLL